jgi:hypothetical protein
MAAKASLLSRMLAATQEPASHAQSRALSWSELMVAQGLSDERAARFLIALRNGATPHSFGVHLKSAKVYCAIHPDYAREALPLLEANAKAARIRKGHKGFRTHCGRGHEFAIHGLGYKNHVNGRRYRYCKLCNLMHSRKGNKLPDEVVAKIKTLVRAGNRVHSFTVAGKPGYLARFSSVKLLRSQDAEFDRLVRLNSQRKIIATNVRMPTLTGRIAAQPDETFSAVDAAVSHRLPHHIRDDVMGRLILDILEGRVDISQVAKYARLYTSQAYNQMNYATFGNSRLVSLDEVPFHDGTATRGDTVSRGLWD